MSVSRFRSTVARSMVVFVSVVLLLSLLLGASATITTTYGDIVEKKTSSTQPSMVTFHSTVLPLSQFKATNDGTVDWYYDTDNSGSTSAGDVRLNQVTVSGTFNVGTVVLTGNNDIGRTLSINGAVCYIDTNTGSGSYYHRGDTRLNPPHPSSAFRPDGEPVYLMKTGCGTVQTGQDQVRVTKAPSVLPNFGGAGAGTRVTSSTAEVGRTTTLLSTNHADAGVRFVDLDLSGGVSSSDPLFLVTNSTRSGPSPGDIRLWASGSTVNFGSAGYGTYVDVDDFESLHTLTTLASAVIRFNAEGGAATVPSCSSASLQHDIWIDIDGNANVSVGDILLAKKSSNSATNVTAGLPIRNGNSHLNTDLSASLNANLAYIDHNGDGVFNYGDNVYLDVGGGSADAKVGSGDIILSSNAFSGTSPGTFGTCVTSGGNLNQPLVATGFPPTISYLSVWNDDLYQPGDIVYVGTTQVTLGDLRWSAILTSFGALGSVVDDNDNDRTYDVSTAGFTPAFCFVPSTGTTYRQEDPIYLVTGSATCALAVRAGDVRITSSAGKAAGTTVQVGDSDFNSPLEQLTAAALKYAESSASQGSSSSYDPYDHLYLDVSGASSQVEVNDVRLTSTAGGAPGTKVRSTDSDVGATLRAFPAAAGGAFDLARVGFVKALPSTTGSTFSAGYRFSDVVAYDIDNNGLVDLGDLWLVGSGGATTTTGSGSPSTPSNSSPVVIIECRGAVGATTLTFDGSKSYDPDGTIQSGSYEWNFGDGQTGTGTSATHTYQISGTLSVSLTVKDTGGAIGSSTYQVKVPLENQDCKPTVVAASPTTTASPSPIETAEPTPNGTASPAPTETGGTDDGDDGSADGEGSPGAALPLVLLAVAALAFVIRRRG